MSKKNQKSKSRPPRLEISDDDRELFDEFTTEASEHLAASEKAILDLESDPSDAEAVNVIFRAFHTLKGVASFIGLDVISNLAHAAESMMALVRDGRLSFTSETADLAFRALDLMRALVGDVAQELAPQRDEVYEALVASLREAAQSKASVKSPPPTAATRSEALDSPSAEVDAEPESLSFLSDAGEGSDAPPHRSEPPAPVLAANSSPQRSSTETRAKAPTRDAAAPDAWVRVRDDRLEKLLDAVGELVIAQAMVTEDTQLLNPELRELGRKIGHAGKVIRELQNLSLSLRMVPLKGTFQKMVRVARDSAQKSDKKVQLVTGGEQTEIDRKLVDVVADPLVHMIRNAVDHGIESPEARRAAGKPEVGRVELKGYHSSGNVVLELSDDGKGLHRDKLVRRAIEKGLITSDAGMSDSEVFALIFEPGFSTNQDVTELSGRGVGMDVVRRGIEGLGGRIDITSTPGEGTTFSLFIPLTLAITDGMLVQVGEERYIIPTGSIEVTFRPDRDQYKTLTQRGEFIIHRGEPIPMFRLHRLFGIQGAVERPTEGLVVVAHVGEERLALLVDDLLGKQQVVTKRLGDGVGRIPGVSGGAILGDGLVGLIVDPGGLIGHARQQDQLLLAS